MNNNEHIIPYFNFFIYNDTGSCLYKTTSNKESQDDLGAMHGILQALFFSSIDLKCQLTTISTDLGVLSYKLFTNKDKMFLLALLFPNYYSDESLCEYILQNLLELIYSFLLIHIGLTDLFSFQTANDIEKLRRYFEIYDKSIHYILMKHSDLSLLLLAEKKYEIEKDYLYSIKHYLEQFKNKLKVDLICLTVKNTVVWASSDWLSLNIIDRLIFIYMSELYSESDINEIPIYFAKTVLEDEGIGKIPYKLFVINLMKETKLILLADNELEIDNINFSFFDDFFISRIINLKAVITFGNEIIDSNVKSVVIYNSFIKTYKIMINEDESKKFEDFILNTCFSSTIYNKNDSMEEFYVKNAENETFYYFRISALTFFMLFDKNTTFDDINNVKLTLKTVSDSFDNRENYNDANEQVK